MSDIDQITYLWHPNATAPSDMSITQVYGWLVDDYGRVLALRNDGRWGIPGGTPEPTDVDYIATLIREVDEEVQAQISDPVYLGYQEVRRQGQVPVAQLRMVARIASLLPRRADPDTGRVHTRLLTSLEDVLLRLNWGTSTTAQATQARHVAETMWQLPVSAPRAPMVLD